MYRLWLDNSINHKIANVVLVANNENQQPAGMVTVALKESAATIGLIAMHRGDRGKKIGQKLIQAAEFYAISNGKTILNVATQKANEPACRFYSKAGYIIQSRIEVWHSWKQNVRPLNR